MSVIQSSQPTILIAANSYVRHRLDPTGRCAFCGHHECQAGASAAKYLRIVGVDLARFDGLTHPDNRPPEVLASTPIR